MIDQPAAPAEVEERSSSPGRYLITGASRGIGAVLAGRLAAAGHQVYGIVRTPPTGEVVELLTGYAVAELTDWDALEDALTELIAELPRLDGLVHSAGIARGGTLADTRPEDFTDQFALNVTAVAALDRLMLPALRAARGTVVYLNSGSGLAARSPLGGYAASKHALRGYADSLRLEEPTVRVCSIYPGRVATDMQREINQTEGTEFRAETYLRPETVADSVVSMLMLPPDGVITDLTLRVRTAT